MVHDAHSFCKYSTCKVMPGDSGAIVRKVLHSGVVIFQRQIFQNYPLAGIVRSEVSCASACMLVRITTNEAT